MCVCVGGGGRGEGVTMCHTHRSYHVVEEIAFKLSLLISDNSIDLKLVTLITGICKSRNLFMLSLCGLFWPRISDYWCVRYYKVSTRPEMTKVTAEQLSQKLF